MRGVSAGHPRQSSASSSSSVDAADSRSPEISSSRESQKADVFSQKSAFGLPIRRHSSPTSVFLPPPRAEENRNPRENYPGNRQAAGLMKKRESAHNAPRERSRDDSSIAYSESPSVSIDLRNTREVDSSIRVVSALPVSRPAGYWNEERLLRHWNGKKRGPGRATGHKNEFLSAPALGVSNIHEYKAASLTFMTRKLEKDDQIIERIGYNGQLVRYDPQKNLTGSMNPHTGEIMTFFRPGFRLRQPIGGYPSEVEPHRRGYLYIKYFIEVGEGPVNRR